MWRNILLNNLGFQRDILRFLIKPPENEKVMGEHEVLGITEDSDLKLDVLGINKE